MQYLYQVFMHTAALQEKVWLPNQMETHTRLVYVIVWIR